MSQRIITGFHAIEEKILKAKDSNSAKGISVFYSKPGPRVKKILSVASEIGISCSQCDAKKLDELVKSLPATSQDHRGIVLTISGEQEASNNIIDFDAWLLEVASKPESEKITVVVLDSVTDPHNVGAILRSCDQFGASLVILPERRGVKDISNEVIARSSAGSSAWVPVAIVPNLVRAVQQLKDKGFWVYGADAGGTHTYELEFANKTVLVMGSEGTGISRLLEEQCDSIVSIPTCGKIDSLNVSVAAGVLLYELYRRNFN